MDTLESGSLEAVPKLRVGFGPTGRNACAPGQAGSCLTTPSF